MRYPEGHKDQTRDRIIDAAGKVFRTQGYAGGGVADVMGEAGLTKGGFYAHFDSKEHLLSETLAAALRRSFELLTHGLDRTEGLAWVEGVIDRYLSEGHFEAEERGCPMPALVSEVARVGGSASAQLRDYVELLTSECSSRVPQLGDTSRATMLAIFASMVGGLSVARAMGDQAASLEVLSACREMLKRTIKHEFGVIAPERRPRRNRKSPDDSSATDAEPTRRASKAKKKR